MFTEKVAMTHSLYEWFNVCSDFFKQIMNGEDPEGVLLKAHRRRSGSLGFVTEETWEGNAQERGNKGLGREKDEVGNKEENGSRKEK